MTNELQTARYDNLVRRLGGLLGPGSKVTETLSELFPVIETEKLPAELMFLGGWVLGMNTSTQSATPGETSRAQIFNPIGSGKIAVLTDCFLEGSGGTYNWQVNETPFPSLFTGIIRDTHAGMNVGTALTTGVLATGNTPQAGRIVLTPANTTIHFFMDQAIAVLAPGSGVEFGSDLDNQALRVTWIWRERIALPSELSFP